MKRILSLALALCLLGLSLPPAASAAASLRFEDVFKKSWYAGSVYALAQRGIVSGTTAATYSPRQALTRGAFLQLLAAATLSDRELEYYKQLDSDFPDVAAGKWYAAGANWGAEKGIVFGSGGRFNHGHSVTRAQAAAFLVRYAENIQHRDLPAPNGSEELFTDDDQIPSWAWEDVYTCRKAGLFSGLPDGSFRPWEELTRAQAASVLCRLLDIPPLEKDQLPDDPTPPPPPQAEYQAPTAFSTTVAGIDVSGLQLDPSKGYNARAMVANDRLFSTESASSFVSRSGAVAAVNGTFFASYDDTNVTFGTVMDQGVFSRIDNSRAPYKPTFAVDADGHASIEFCKINQVLTVTRDGEPVDAVENVGCNVALPETDGSRMMYTSRFGGAVPGHMADAVEVNADGIVTRVYHEGVDNVTVPADGFLVAVRARRWDGDPLYTAWQVGDKVTVSTQYEGASRQSFTAMLSCGPTLVKNGAAYGDIATYAQEGYTEEKITTWTAARMAIGVKADGTVVIAHCTCTMAQLSQVMLGLGCVNAMNLDGGASCALYLNGSALVSEGRLLNNMLVFTKK